MCVLFARHGGMGDVGKYAVLRGIERPGVELTPVALTFGAEDQDCHLAVDVDDSEAHAAAVAAFGRLDIPNVDVASAGALDELSKLLSGADAVVACIGNRQAKKSYGTWCATGAEVVVAAMEAAKCQRLVCLSSMGINDDFLPWNSPIKLFWSAFLTLVSRAQKKDLYAMEATVQKSGLDWLLVRAMGLTPSEKPTGRWDLLTARGQGGLALGIAKQDVADFMLDEGQVPTLHRVGVTVGHK